METLFDTITRRHKIRFYPRQKKRFRDFIIAEFDDLGYDNIAIDRHKNIVVGDLTTAKVVYSAHYDTPFLSPYITPFTRFFGHLIGQLVAVFFILLFCWGIDFAVSAILKNTTLDIFSTSMSRLIFLLIFIITVLVPNPNNANDNTSGVLAVYEIAKRMKEEDIKGNYAFILFNNEELGLLGSSGLVRDFRIKHDYRPHFLLYNFDSIGSGNRILMSYKSLKCRSEIVEPIAQEINFNNEIAPKIIRANILAGSDHLFFINGIMFTSVKRALFGSYYLPKIHMPYDRKLDFEMMDKIISYAMKNSLKQLESISTNVTAENNL